jgi:hypothetical protein
VIAHKTVNYKNLFLIEGKSLENAGCVAGRVKILLQRMKLPEEIVRQTAIVKYETKKVKHPSINRLNFKGNIGEQMSCFCFL